jgi:hypothetical protein
VREAFTLGLGQLSLVAIAAFILGKFWSASEAVFASRQRAYSDFIRKCVLAHELLLENKDKTIEGLLPSLRDASAEFSLYASPRANELAGRYAHKLGFVVGADDPLDKRSIEALEEASQIYFELIAVMRRDALGLTVYGIVDWLSGRRKAKS